MLPVQTEPTDDTRVSCLCVQLRGIQKLTSPLKLLMNVTVRVKEESKSATIESQTDNIPAIAADFRS